MADHVGAELLRIRQNRRLTQTDAAAQIGVARTMLSDYERGTVRPGLQQLGRMLDAYEATADERDAVRLAYTDLLADPAHDDLTEAAP